MKQHIVCNHERHQLYQKRLSENQFERAYLWNIGVYINDPKINPNDEEDIDFFQDLIFESPYGRIHRFFYEELFKNYLYMNRDWTLRTFSKFVLFLDKISNLLSEDALAFLFEKQEIQVIIDMFNIMDIDFKLKFIKMADKYPNVMRAIPKLKLYNLFS